MALKRRASNQNASLISPPSAPGPSHLFALPQELQDPIFDFAHIPAWPYYLPRFGAKYATAFGRFCRLARPESQKVSKWLVSKRFFLAAARAYMNSLQHGDLEDLLFLKPGLHGVSPDTLRQQFGLFLQFGKHLDVTFGFGVILERNASSESPASNRWSRLVLAINACCALDYVRMQLNGLFFTQETSAHSTELVSDTALARLIEESGLKKARGLKGLQLDAAYDSPDGSNDDEIDVF